MWIVSWVFTTFDEELKLQVPLARGIFPITEYLGRSAWKEFGDKVGYVLLIKASLKLYRREVTNSWRLMKKGLLDDRKLYSYWAKCKEKYFRWKVHKNGTFLGLGTNNNNIYYLVLRKLTYIKWSNAHYKRRMRIPVKQQPGGVKFLFGNVPVISKTAHPSFPSLTKVLLRTMENLTKLRLTQSDIWLSCRRTQKDSVIVSAFSMTVHRVHDRVIAPIFTVLLEHLWAFEKAS